MMTHRSPTAGSDGSERTCHTDLRWAAGVARGAGVRHRSSVSVSGAARGTALVVVLAVLALLATFALAMARLMSLERGASSNHIVAKQARLAAEAGFHRAVAELARSELREPFPTSTMPWAFRDPAGTDLGIGLPIDATPNPSLAGGTDTLGAFSGVLGASYTDAGDRYVLRVQPTSAQVHLGLPTERLAPMLDTLGRAIAEERARLGLSLHDPVAGRGAEIAAFRDDRGGLDRKDELRELLADDDWEALRQFVCVDGWVDLTTVRFFEMDEDNGVPLFEGEPRAPIDVNTASRPVLIAAFAGVAAIDVPPVTFEQAASMADELIRYRESDNPDEGAISTWEELFELVDSFANPTAGGLTPEQATALKVNANPNLTITALNPDLVINLGMDKSHVVTPTTELSFLTMGIYEIESLGRIHDREGVVLAEAELRVVARIYDLLRLTTQTELELHRTSGLVDATATFPSSMDEDQDSSRISGYVQLYRDEPYYEDDIGGFRARATGQPFEAREPGFGELDPPPGGELVEEPAAAAAQAALAAAGGDPAAALGAVFGLDDGTGDIAGAIAALVALDREAREATPPEPLPPFDPATAFDPATGDKTRLIEEILALPLTDEEKTQLLLSLDAADDPTTQAIANLLAGPGTATEIASSILTAAPPPPVPPEEPEEPVAGGPGPLPPPPGEEGGPGVPAPGGGGAFGPRTLGLASGVMPEDGGDLFPDGVHQSRAKERTLQLPGGALAAHSGELEFWFKPDREQQKLPMPLFRGQTPLSPDGGLQHNIDLTIDGDAFKIESERLFTQPPGAEPMPIPYEFGRTVAGGTFTGKTDPNEWHHLRVTWVDGLTQQIFLDGESVPLTASEGVVQGGYPGCLDAAVPVQEPFFEVGGGFESDGSSDFRDVTIDMIRVRTALAKLDGVIPPPERFEAADTDVIGRFAGEFPPFDVDAELGTLTWTQHLPRSYGGQRFDDRAFDASVGLIVDGVEFRALPGSDKIDPSVGDAEGQEIVDLATRTEEINQKIQAIRDQARVAMDELRAAAGAGDGTVPAGYEDMRNGRGLGKGDRGKDVQALQEALNQAGYPAPTSGVFDEATRQAVIDLERDSMGAAGASARPNGYVGKHTKRVIDQMLGYDPSTGTASTGGGITKAEAREQARAIRDQAAAEIADLEAQLAELRARETAGEATGTGGSTGEPGTGATTGVPGEPGGTTSSGGSAIDVGEGGGTVSSGGGAVPGMVVQGEGVEFVVEFTYDPSLGAPPLNVSPVLDDITLTFRVGTEIISFRWRTD